MTAAMTPQIGRESQLFAKGKWWTVGRLTIDVWEELVVWAAGRIHNPLEELRPILKDLDPALAVQLVREAQAARPAVLTIEHRWCSRPSTARSRARCTASGCCSNNTTPR